MLKITVQTWLATCLLSTLLIIAYYNSTEHHSLRSEEMLVIGGLILGVGLVVTLPAMIGLALLGNHLNKTMKRDQARTICSVYLIAAAVASFVILASMLGIRNGDDIDKKMILIPMPYLLCSILSIWIFSWPALHSDESSASGVANAAFDEGYQPAYPQNTAGIILGVGILQLAYGLFSWVSANPFSNTPTTMYFLLSSVSDILLIIGLVLFWRKNATGWKILTMILVSGVAGFCLSFVVDLEFYLRYIRDTPFSMLKTLLFPAISLTLAILLQTTSMKQYFKIPQREATLWIVAGIGYCILHQLITRFMLHLF